MSRFLLKVNSAEYTGKTFSSLLSQFISFDEARILHVKFPGYEERVFHSYSSEYTDAEMLSDAVHFVKEKVKSGDYWPRVKLYQEICNV